MSRYWDGLESLGATPINPRIEGPWPFDNLPPAVTFDGANSSLGGGSSGGIDVSFAVVPLAIPLLAGPGAISGAILYGTRVHSTIQMALLGGVFVLVGIATWVSLIAATPMVRILKQTGIDIATRVMGLVIAAIAVEMIAHGVGSLFGLTVAV